MSIHSLSTCVLFGEAEKGDFQKAYFCHSIDQLSDYLGNPPPLSLGLYYAIRILLYQQNLIYFRVKEEGYSQQDYFAGFKNLKNNDLVTRVNAICIPGVGTHTIIEEAIPICQLHHSVLVLTESDMYDYLTEVT